MQAHKRATLPVNGSGCFVDETSWVHSGSKFQQGSPLVQSHLSLPKKYVGPIADRFLTTKIVAVFTETERTHLAPCYYWVQGEEAVAASGSGCSLCHCQLAALNT